MKTVAYLRISTDKQDEASQRQIIADWCKQNGRDISAYATDQASGALPWQERALNFALRDCEAGDSIIVSEISRIARSTVGVLTFLQAAAEKSINVVAIKSGITLDGSTASKIVVTVLAMAAEIERDLLRERTKGALQARKESGLPIGRQAGATGKKNKLDGKWNEIEPLLKAGVAKAAVARVLGVSRQTLHSFLENREGLNGND
jgi:DNA invertase Pin-like site-specific DNA recombinase